MKRVSITALLEISDHDGYCSGEECDYTSRQIVHLCDIPKGVQKDCTDETLNQYDWTQCLPQHELNDGGSGYCDNSAECEDAGLSRHDYKYTILKVEFVESD